MPRSSPRELRVPGEILLLSTYAMGHSPTGLSSLAAFLKPAGFEPRLLDLATGPLESEAVKRAWWVGIHVPMHTALRLGILVAKKVRVLNPSAHICFYGLYASLNASLLLSDDGAGDSVVGGEFEPVVVEWIQALESATLAQKTPRPPPGVSLRGHPAAPRMARTEFKPSDRRGLLPLDRYAHLQIPGGTRVVGYVESTRGCKHSCRHCPIPPVYQGRFYAVSRPVVMENILHLVREGAQHITFGDPDFLNGPGHALALVKELHERVPAVTYDFTAKVEHLLAQRHTLTEFARTGCLFVITAVESLEEEVLRVLNKGHDRTQVKAALDLLRQAGIAPRPTFVPFTPWSTLEGYLNLLNFLAAEGLVNHVDPVQLSIRLLVPPGSLLQQDPQFLPHRDLLDPASLTWRWRHPDPRMDALQQRVRDRVEAGSKDSAETVFLEVRRLAEEALNGRQEVAGAASPLLPQPPAPRLSEPWFC